MSEVIMMNMVREGLVRQRTWSEDELSEARRLLEVCNAYEGLSLKLDVWMLRSRKGNEVNDFLYYEDGKLVGLLALDEYGARDKEFTGMVLPEYRRRGIFSKLLAVAKEEARARGIERLILICERFSRSGQAFVEACGAVYDFSEHKMVLADFKERGEYKERISLRKAGPHGDQFRSLYRGDEKEYPAKYGESARSVLPWETRGGGGGMSEPG
ncbi:MAG: GNAT family N-acetyltransferase [Chloroflexi bacterium]|nr:MAG: GNAT family N-acetyltransferase [Chloroflexota bacterium]